MIKNRRIPVARTLNGLEKKWVMRQKHITAKIVVQWWEHT
jgi:hypothetical protein